MQTRKVIIRTLSIVTVAAVAALLAPSAEGAAGTTKTSTTPSKTSTLQQAAKNVYQPAWKSAPTTALAYDCVALPLTLANKSIVAGAPAVPTGGAVLTLSATGATLYSDAKCSVAASTFTMTAPSATVYLRAPTTPGSVTVTAAGDGTTVLSASTTLNVTLRPGASLVITSFVWDLDHLSHSTGITDKCTVGGNANITVSNRGSAAAPAGGTVGIACGGTYPYGCGAQWSGTEHQLPMIPAGTSVTLSMWAINTGMRCGSEANYGGSFLATLKCPQGTSCAGPAASPDVGVVCAAARDKQVIPTPCP